MKEIIVTKNDANQRVDKFLLKTFPNLSKSMMYKAIRNKKIKVNRKRCTFDQKLVEEDHILLFLPPDVLEEKERKILKSLPLDIVYEDENILIVDKPVGLRSQKDIKGTQDCLVSRIQSYLYEKNEWNPDIEHAFAPTICHRLDRNTSGLVIAAKNAEALRKVNESIKNHKVHKFYRAWVEGNLTKPFYPMEYYLKKEGTMALVSKVKKPGFVKAKMNVRVLQRKKDRTYIEVELLTGRFHQIRALMAFIGHPLCKDRKYGSKEKGQYELDAYRIIIDVDLPLKQNVFEKKPK